MTPLLITLLLLLAAIRYSFENSVAEEVNGDGANSANRIDLEKEDTLNEYNTAPQLYLKEGYCGPGYYLNGGNCEICPMGFKCPEGFLEGIETNEEQNQLKTSEFKARASTVTCPSGMYSIGSLPCVRCPKGMGCDGTNPPQFCPIDTKLDTSTSRCVPLSSNEISGGEKSMKCPKGFSANSNGTLCIPAPPGSFSNRSTSSPCDSTSISLGGAYKCTDGRFSGYKMVSSKTSTLIPCYPGTYPDSPGSCTDCPIGSYCPDGYNEYTCPNGHIAPYVGMASCVRCPFGLKKLNETTCGYCGDKQVAIAGVCTDISPYTQLIKSTTTPNSVTIVTCPIGTYRPNTESSCVSCPKGSSCRPGEGTKSVCSSIGGKTTTSVEGSNFCIETPLGHKYNSTGDTYEACNSSDSQGYYFSFTNNTCNLCKAKNYCPNGIQTLPCKEGFTSSSGALHCIACDGNKRCTGGEVFGCENSKYCPLGHPTGVFCDPGTTYQGTKCVECGAGKFCPGDGGSRDCGSGYVCEGQVKYKFDSPCKEGYYDGGGICEICPPGKYCPPGTSGGNVIICPPGFYCPEGTTRWYEHPCPAGKQAATDADPPAGPIGGLEKEADCNRQCKVGHYCPAGTVYPIPCPAGTFNAIEGKGRIYDCTKCPAGKACSTPGLAAPNRDCEKGHYCPEGTRYPSEFSCPEGTYNDEIGSTSISDCKTCTAGYVCPRGTTTDPSTDALLSDLYKCPMGYYCEGFTGIFDGATSFNRTYQAPCPEGTYNSVRGLTSKSGCTVCPNGYYCLEGSVAPTGPCPVGYYCSTTGAVSSVQRCKEGTYSDEQGADECKLCPGGHFCPVGSSKPIPCSPGTYRVFTTATAGKCGTCLAGAFCKGGAEYPLVCPPGTYSDAGKSECVPCPAGHHCYKTSFSAPPSSLTATGHFGLPQAELAGHKCTEGYYCPEGMDHKPEEADKCPMGYYCPNDYIDMLPVPCVRGTYGGAKGLIDQSGCTKCEKGKFCEGGNTTPSGLCAHGYYCEEGSHSAQQAPCPAGRYGPKEGLGGKDECTECEEGYYCPLASISPIQCPQGHFCGAGSSHPMPCPQGTYSGNAGNTEIAECVDCPPGMYCSGIGLKIPTGPCDPGYICFGGSYTPTPNIDQQFNDTKNRGKPCSTGHFCMQGALREEPCSPGYYNPYTGGTSPDSCLPCPAGYFCGLGGVGDLDEVDNSITGPRKYIHKCEAGFYCTGYATTARQHMTPPGYYSEVGASQPTLCVPGTRQPLPAQSQCISCGSGSAPDGLNGGYCPDYGMIDPLPCPVGSTCTGTLDASTYDPCPAGEYNPGKSFDGNGCRPCPPGRICLFAGMDRPGFSETDGLLDECEPGYYCRKGVAVRNPATGHPDSGKTCPKGHYCPYGTFEPMTCPIGTYNEFEGKHSLSSCLPCPSGFVCSRSGLEKHDYVCSKGYFCSEGAYTSSPTDRTTGDICKPGYYCPEGVGAPIKCPVGEYSDTFGASTCTECPEGYYCPIDGDVYRKKLPCTPGHYCPLKTSVQFACPIGTFSLNFRNIKKDDCDKCPPGMYCKDQGMVDYVEKDSTGVKNRCEAGYVCAKGCGDSKCNTGYGNVGKTCPIGHYCPKGTANEVKCPAGTFNAKSGSTSITDCEACPEGYYCGEAESGIGRLCEEGYYCKQYERTLSVLVDGTSTEITLKFGASTGRPTDGVSGNICPMGYNCPVGSKSPVKTRKGYYKDYFGKVRASGLSICPAGFFCPEGTFYYENNVCARGYYCPEGSSTPQALPCPVGTYSNKVMLKTSSECTECSPGYHCDTTSLQLPTGECSDGYYCGGGSSTPTPAGNFFFNTSTSSKNGRCPEGYYCPKGSSRPVPCKSGYYCNQGTSVPAECTPGYYCAQSEGDGYVTHRKICPAGNYCPQRSALPVPCPVGTYNIKSGVSDASECSQCDPGFYCNTIGMAVKPTERCGEGYYCPAGSIVSNPPNTVCELGHYCPAGSSISIPCAAGTYQDLIGEPVCKTCPAGFYCLEKQVTPKNCPTGSYCPSGSKTFIKCPVSTYNDVENMTKLEDCRICPGGYYCDVEGLSDYSNKKCKEGYYCLEGTTKEMFSSQFCPRGSYCPEGTYMPVKCPVGTYNDATKKITIGDCKKCKTGYYCDREGSINYGKKCNPGYLCPEGTYSPTPNEIIEGSVLKAGPCEEGHYCPAGTTAQISCKDGTYNPDRGASECIKCPAGFYCIDSAKSPIICPEGSYCPSGYSKFNSGDKVGSLPDCPGGTYGDGLGYTNVGDCKPCPIGMYCEGGNKVWTPCNAGKWCLYGADSGQIDSVKPRYYVDCPRGAYCEEGSTIPEFCPPGTFNADTGQGTLESCKNCAAGKVCVNYGTSSELKYINCETGFYCLEGSTTTRPSSTDSNGDPELDTNGAICPRGHFCPKQSSVPTECPMGKYNDLYQQGSCSTCPSGFYCDETKMIKPKECPKGNVCLVGSDGLGTACPSGTFDPYGGLALLRECKLCPPGKACSSPGTTDNYADCEEGYYCVKGSTTTIPSGDSYKSSNCPAGHFCPAGSSAPITCPLGSYSDSETSKDSTSCNLCDKGSYCDEIAATITSDLCYGGYYCPQNSTIPMVTKCEKGHECPPGSYEQTVCVDGTYAPELSDSCLDCPEGYFCKQGLDGISITVPTVCPKGQYCPINTITPFNCPKGTYMDTTGATSVRDCIKCPPGYYCDREGMIDYRLTKCKPGYYCEGGVSESEPATGICPTGYFCPEGSSYPTPCPIGSLGLSTGLYQESQCSKCSAGRYCSRRGMTTTNDFCSPGYYCPEGYNYEAKPINFICPIGSHCPEGSSKPTLCSGGTYSEKEGLTNCEMCPPGYYCNYETDPSIIVKQPCKAGYFCPSGTENPIVCPDGTFGTGTDSEGRSYNYLGLISSSDCIPCIQGHYCTSGKIQGICDPGYVCMKGSPSTKPVNQPVGAICQKGYYCPGGTKFMVPCPINTWSKNEGAQNEDQCDLCDKGYYCVGGKRYPCAPGHYCPNSVTDKDDINSIQPIQCPERTYNAGEGKSKVEECLPCPSGYFCNRTGISNFKQFLCPSGHYCESETDEEGNLTAGAVATVCPGGTYRPELGGVSVDSCHPCEKGFYCPPGSADMERCLNGFYCPENTEVPKKCGAGTVYLDSTEVNTTEEVTCVPCPPGHYCEDKGGDIVVVAEPCNPGYICTGGAAKPNPTGTNEGGYKCPDGYWCASGAEVEVACEMGQYKEYTEGEIILGSKSDCQACSPGSFNPLVGQSKCISCGSTALPIRDGALIDIISGNGDKNTNYGANQCLCLGRDRVFQSITKSCVCASGFTTSDGTNPEDDSLSDCVPVIYPRCKSNEGRYISGRCWDRRDPTEITPCVNQCLGGMADLIKGICECSTFGSDNSAVPGIDSICNAKCRRHSPVMRAISAKYDLSVTTTSTSIGTSETSFRLVDKTSNMADRLAASSDNDEDSETLPEFGTIKHLFNSGPNIVSLAKDPESDPSYFYIYESGSNELNYSGIRHKVSCEANNECRIYLVTVGLEYKTQNNVTTTNTAEVFAGFYNYEVDKLRTHIMNMTGSSTTRVGIEEIFNSNDALYNPTVCLEHDQILMLMYPTNTNTYPQRYVPFYYKESLLNTNKNYDASFWSRQTKNNDTIAYYSFPKDGVYTFGIYDSAASTGQPSGEYNGSILIVRYMSNTSSCALTQPISTTRNSALIRIGVSMDKSISEKGSSSGFIYEVVGNEVTNEPKSKTNSTLNAKASRDGSEKTVTDEELNQTENSDVRVQPSTDSTSLLVAPDFKYLLICGIILVLMVVFVVLIFWWMRKGGFGSKLHGSIAFTDTMATPAWRSLSPTALLPILDNRRSESEIRMRVNPATANMLAEGGALPSLEGYDIQLLKKMYWGGYNNYDLPNVPGVSLGNFDVEKFVQSISTHQKIILSRMNALNKLASERMEEAIDKISLANDIMGEIDVALEDKKKEEVETKRSVVPPDELEKYLGFLTRQQDALNTMMEASVLSERKTSICIETMTNYANEIHNMLTMLLNGSVSCPVEYMLSTVKETLEKMEAMETSAFQSLDMFINGTWGRNTNTKQPGPSKISSRKQSAVVLLLLNIEFGRLYNDLNRPAVPYNNLVETDIDPSTTNFKTTKRAKVLYGLTYKDPQTGLVHPSFDPPTYIIMRRLDSNVIRPPVVIDNAFISRNFSIEPSTGFVLPTASTVFLDREQSALNKSVLVHISEIMSAVQNNVINIDFKNLIKGEGGKVAIESALSYLMNRFIPFIPSPDDTANICPLSYSQKELLYMLRSPKIPFVADIKTGLRVPVMAVTILHNGQVDEHTPINNSNSPLFPICGVCNSGVTGCSIPYNFNEPVLRGVLENSIEKALEDVEREKQESEAPEGTKEDKVNKIKTKLGKGGAKQEKAHLEPICGGSIRQDGAVSPSTIQINDIFGNPSFAAIGMPSLCYQTNAIIPIHSVVSTDKGKIINTGSSNLLAHALVVGCFEKSLKVISSYSENIRPVFNGLLEAYTKYNNNTAKGQAATELENTLSGIRRGYKSSYGEDVIVRGLRNNATRWIQSGTIYDNYWNGVSLQVNVIKRNVACAMKMGSCDASPTGIVFPYVNVDDKGDGTEKTSLLFTPPKINVSGVSGRAPITMNELKRLSKLYKKEIIQFIKLLYGEKTEKHNNITVKEEGDLLAMLNNTEEDKDESKDGILMSFNKLYEAVDRITLLLNLSLNCVDPTSNKASRQPTWPSGGASSDKTGEFIADLHSTISNLTRTIKMSFNFVNRVIKERFSEFEEFAKLAKTPSNNFEFIADEMTRIAAGEITVTRVKFLSKLKDFSIFVAKTAGSIIEEDENMMRGNGAKKWASYRERHERLSDQMNGFTKQMDELFEGQYIVKTSFFEGIRKTLSALSFVYNHCIYSQEEMFKQPLLLKLAKDEDGTGPEGAKSKEAYIIEKDPRFKKSMNLLLDLMLKTDNPKLAALKERAKEMAAKNKELNRGEADPFEEEEEGDEELSNKDEYDYLSISKAKENEVISDIMKEKAALISGIDENAEDLRQELAELHHQQDEAVDSLPDGKELKKKLLDLRKEEEKNLEAIKKDINSNIVASINEKVKNSTLYEELSRLNDKNTRHEIMRNTDLSDEIRRLEKTAEAQNAIELKEFDEQAERTKKTMVQQLQNEFKKQQELVPNSELRDVVMSQENQMNMVKTKMDEELNEQRRLLIEKLNAKKSVLVSEAKIRHGTNELDLKLQQNDANINKEISEVVIKHNESRVQNEKKLLDEYMAKVKDAEAELARDIKDGKQGAFDKCRKSIGKLKSDFETKREKYELEARMALDAKLNGWRDLKEQHAVDISKALTSSVKKETDTINNAKRAEAELNERMKFEKEQAAKMAETFKILSKKFAVSVARAEDDEGGALCKEYIATVGKLSEELKSNEQRQREELQQKLLMRKQGKKTKKGIQKGGQGKPLADEGATGTDQSASGDRRQDIEDSTMNPFTGMPQFGADMNFSLESGIEGFNNLTFDVNASLRLGNALGDAANTSAAQQPTQRQGKTKTVDEELIDRTGQVYGNVKSMVDEIEAKIYEIDPRPILIESAKTGDGVDVDGIIEKQLNAVANLKTAFKMDEDEQRRVLEERMKRKRLQRSENQTKRISLMEQATFIEENNKMEEERIANMIDKVKDQDTDAGGHKHKKRGVSAGELEVAIEEKNVGELTSLQSQFDVELKKAALDCDEEIREKYEAQLAQMRKEQVAEIQALFERVGSNMDSLTSGRVDVKKLNEIDLESVDLEYLEMVRRHKKAVNQVEMNMERDIRDEQERRSQELSRNHVQAKSEMIKKQIADKTRILGELFPKLFNSEDKMIKQRRKDTEALRKRLEEEKREMEQKINEEIRKIGEENARKVEEEKQKIEAEFDEMLRQEVLKAKGERMAIQEIKNKVLVESGKESNSPVAGGALGKKGQRMNIPTQQLGIDIPSLDDLSNALKESVASQLSDQSQQLKRKIEEMKRKKQQRLEEMKNRMDNEMNKQINAKQEERKQIQNKAAAEGGDENTSLLRSESSFAIRRKQSSELLRVQEQENNMTVNINTTYNDNEVHSTNSQSDSGDIVDEPSAEGEMSLSDQKELILQKVDGRVSALNELVTQLREFGGGRSRASTKVEHYVDEFDDAIRNEGILTVAKPEMLTKEERENLVYIQRVASNFHKLGVLPLPLTVKAATHLPDTNYAKLGNTFCRSFYFDRQPAKKGECGTLYIRTERLTSPILPVIITRCIAHIVLDDWSDESPSFQREFSHCVSLLRRAADKGE